MKHIALAALAALALLAPAAHAQSLTLNDGDVVTVDGTGTHGTVNNATTSYTDSGHFYAVRTSGTAAFTLGTGGTLTAQSGDFGLAADGSGPINITGGSITAGTDGFGLFAGTGGSVTITGGTLTAGSGGFGLVASGGSIDLYGMFNGYALGNTTLASGGTNGSFTGTLTNNTAPQTFTYQNFGTITLHNLAPAAAPEPSQFAAFAVGLLGLGALGVKARKRNAA